MKAAQMTREDEIRSISQKYEMDKEKVRDILKRGPLCRCGQSGAFCLHYGKGYRGSTGAPQGRALGPCAGQAGHHGRQV